MKTKKRRKRIIAASVLIPLLLGIVMVCWYALSPTQDAEDYAECELLFEVKDYWGCIAHVTEYMDTYGEEYRAYLLRGDAYFALGEYERAIEDYSSYLAGDKFAHEVYYKRGVAHDKLGNGYLANSDLCIACEFDYRPACDYVLESERTPPEHRPEERETVIPEGDIAPPPGESGPPSPGTGEAPPPLIPSGEDPPSLTSLSVEDSGIPPAGTPIPTIVPVDDRKEQILRSLIDDLGETTSELREDTASLEEFLEKAPLIREQRGARPEDLCAILLRMDKTAAELESVVEKTNQDISEWDVLFEESDYLHHKWEQSLSEWNEALTEWGEVDKTYREMSPGLEDELDRWDRRWTTIKVYLIYAPLILVILLVSAYIERRRKLKKERKQKFITPKKIRRYSDLVTMRLLVTYFLVFFALLFIGFLLGLNIPMFYFRMLVPYLCIGALIYFATLPSVGLAFEFGITIAVFAVLFPLTINEDNLGCSFEDIPLFLSIVFSVGIGPLLYGIGQFYRKKILEVDSFSSERSISSVEWRGVVAFFLTYLYIGASTFYTFEFSLFLYLIITLTFIVYLSHIKRPIFSAVVGGTCLSLVPAVVWLMTYLTWSHDYPYIVDYSGRVVTHFIFWAFFLFISTLLYRKYEETRFSENRPSKREWAVAAGVGAAYLSLSVFAFFFHWTIADWYFTVMGIALIIGTAVFFFILSRPGRAAILGGAYLFTAVLANHVLKLFFLNTVRFHHIVDINLVIAFIIGAAFGCLVSISSRPLRRFFLSSASMLYAVFQVWIVPVFLSSRKRTRYSLAGLSVVLLVCAAAVSYLIIQHTKTEEVENDNILIGPDEPIEHVVFSPDGGLMAYETGDREITVWDTLGDGRIARIEVQDDVGETAFSPTGRYLLYSLETEPDILYIHDVESDEAVGELDSAGGCFTFLPDGGGGLFLEKTEAPFCGFLDEEGNIVITTKYDAARPFSHGLAAVKEDGRYGFIDMNGEEVVKPEFFYASIFSAGYSMVVYKSFWGIWDFRFGYIDKTGRLVIDCKEYMVGRFTGDYAPARYRGKYGFIDESGDFVIEPVFEDCNLFIGESAPVKIDGEWKYINESGEFILDTDFDYAEENIESLAAVYDGEKWGFINSDGELVISCVFDEVGWFSEGVCPVRIGDRWGYIEPVFYSETITDEYVNSENLWRYSEVLELVDVDGEPAFRNKSYRFVVEPRFDDASCFFDGLARVVIDEKCGYINTSGGYVFEPQFEEGSMFSEGVMAAKKEYLNAVTRYDMGSGDRELFIVYRHLKSDITDLIASPDGRTIVLVSACDKITLWDTSRSTSRYTNGLHPRDILFSPHDSSILVFTEDHEALVIDGETSDILSHRAYEIRPGITKTDVDWVSDDFTYLILNTYAEYYDETDDYVLTHETSKVLWNLKTGEAVTLAMRRLTDTPDARPSIPDVAVWREDILLVPGFEDPSRLSFWSLEDPHVIDSMSFDDPIIGVSVAGDGRIVVVTETGMVTLLEGTDGDSVTLDIEKTGSFSLKE